MSRCVECGLPKDRHAEDLSCPSGSKRYASLDLPEGAHCRDCIHIGFCTGFLGNVADNTTCDWFPIRFVPKWPPKPEA